MVRQIRSPTNLAGTSLLVLIFVAASAMPSTVAANIPPDALQLPTAPNVGPLDTPITSCSNDVHVADFEKCRADWENYRVVTLERYNSAVKDYIAALKVVDRRNERWHAHGKITDDQHDDTRDAIALELTKTADAGSYMTEYFSHLATYKQAIRDALNGIARRKAYCATQMGDCN
jgi:hypothetical protein